MTWRHEALLTEIKAFLSKTGMGPTYFGLRAANNPHLVSRLEDRRRVWPETEDKVRAFMARANESADRAPRPPSQEGGGRVYSPEIGT